MIDQNQRCHTPACVISSDEHGYSPEALGKAKHAAEAADGLIERECAGLAHLRAARDAPLDAVPAHKSLQLCIHIRKILPVGPVRADIQAINIYEKLCMIYRVPSGTGKLR